MNTERKLYQWDTGQKLVGCTGLYVDFPIGNEVYRVETTNGMCIIPDELLQTSGSHKVYECMTNNTIRSFAFSVTPRPQPPDYVYTPTERLTFEGLVQKVDDAVADMIRRAESGEFDGHTPVKGTDYFTTAEIQQIQNEVSSGAIGEFKSVVDTETETFNTNAETKLNAYNQNDSQKTTSYNTNATKKLNEYNTNANNRVAEFNSHTEQIQTDISELKSDLTGLQTVVDSKADKTELAKTNLYLDALYKLNKGQTYDVLEQESEAYSVDVPSGSRYVGIDKVGGKSVIFAQLAKVTSEGSGELNGITLTNNGDGSFTINGTATETAYFAIGKAFTLVPNRRYCIPSIELNERFYFRAWDSNSISKDISAPIFTADSDYGSVGNVYLRMTKDNTFDNVKRHIKVFDITNDTDIQSVDDFVARYPNWENEPYSEPTIISSQTDRLDVASADGTITQQITTGFPVLNSAGSVYDYIDLNDDKLHRRVGAVDLGSLSWRMSGSRFEAPNFINGGKENSLICSAYESKGAVDKSIYKSSIHSVLVVYDSDYTDVESFKQAMQGVMMYYELAEEVITDITIPTELTDWLTVEAGGSITFHNSDDGKRLLIPNKLSFVRKLDEVTV